MTGIPPDSLIALLRVYQSLDVEQQKAIASRFVSNPMLPERDVQQFNPASILALTTNSPAFISDTLAPIFGRPGAIRAVPGQFANRDEMFVGQNIAQGGTITAARDPSTFRETRKEVRDKVLTHEFAHNAGQRAQSFQIRVAREGFQRATGFAGPWTRGSPRSMEELYANTAEGAVTFLRRAAQMTPEEIAKVAEVKNVRDYAENTTQSRTVRETRPLARGFRYLVMKLLNVEPFRNHPQRQAIQQLMSPQSARYR